MALRYGRVQQPIEMSTSDNNTKKNTPPETVLSAGRDSDNEAWDRRIGVASCVSFLLGCVWILLFPLVTLTTGESKPRGTFFDENAMLVHHTSTKLTAADVDWAKPARLIEAYPQQVNISCRERNAVPAMSKMWALS